MAVLGAAAALVLPLEDYPAEAVVAAVVEAVGAAGQASLRR